MNFVPQKLVHKQARDGIQLGQRRKESEPGSGPQIGTIQSSLEVNVHEMNTTERGLGTIAWGKVRVFVDESAGKAR